MTEDAFIIKNKKKWEKLADYNRRLPFRSAARLAPDGLREFVGLYRAANHHLAYARTHFAGGDAEDYLNGVVANAHNRFHTRERFRFSRVITYFTNDFPARFREDFMLFVISAAAYAFGALCVYFICAAEPSLLKYFIPEGSVFVEGAAQDSWSYPLIGSIVVTNNIRVAAMAMALGFTAGIGTLYMLLYNGGVIGAYACAAAAGNYAPAAFWSLILPHGITELAAIFISGAAGLMIGRAALVPGGYRRGDAVVIAAKRAAFMIPGVAAMLLAAGLIEGFFTPLAIVYRWKYIFAALTALFLACYFTFAGRNRA